jgi:hypothetical protein
MMLMSRCECVVSELLEPCAVKVASTVLRGGRAGNVSPLPDKYLHVWERDAQCYTSISLEMPRYFKIFPVRILPPVGVRLV